MDSLTREDLVMYFIIMAKNINNLTFMGKLNKAKQINTKSIKI